MSIIKLQGTAEFADGIYYEVETSAEPLGSGGMGTVYLASRVDALGHRRPAAVKFLFSDLPPTVIDRARQEASVRVKNDNLVEMFGFIQIDQTDEQGVTMSRYHVASELLHGVMLYDLLRGKTTDKDGNEIAYAQELVRLMESDREKFALTVVKSILSGVMALHDAGYVHRDIDPSNIMITSDRKIKLIDFGLVKNFNDQSPQLSVVGQIIGKPAYAAPETVCGWIDDQNPSTDIYSVGILMYELAMGKLPFTGTSVEVIEQQKNAPLPVSEIKNQDLVKVLLKSTAKKQSARYQSAAEFRVDVEHIISGVPVSLSTNVPSKPVQGNNSMFWLYIVLAVIAGFALAYVVVASGIFVYK